jgi:Leucine-rich repeat (LRR) protein
MKNAETNETKPSWHLCHRWRNILAAFLITLSIIAALVFIWFTQEEPKPDPASEAIIRKIAAKQLNKDPNDMTDDDFAKITKFDLYKKELCDIRLLEKFRNLKMLYLGEILLPKKNIPNWMKYLAKLGILDLNERFALDLSPIEKLTNIQDVRLGTMPIKNLKPLVDLVNIEHLQLYHTSVSDLEPIKELKKLEVLYIADDSLISDIGPLETLTNLKDLELIGTKVTDLKPLHGLINLELLSVSNTRVSDLDALKGLKNLKELLLPGTSVSNLEPIMGLTKLQILYLVDCNNITDDQVNNLQKILPKLRISRKPGRP